MAAVGLVALLALAWARSAVAADADDQPAFTSITNSAGGETRYGLFNGLDHRSAYTREVFPEPFIVDDMALEDNELEVTWSHSKGRARQNDTESVEYQKGFGLLTLEASVAFQRIVTPDGIVNGLGPLELGARYPFYQFVSANRMIDATFGPALQSAIPLQLRVDPNAELEPQVFCDLLLAEHITIQTVAGYDVVFGSGDNGGERSYEFGASFGYLITRPQLSLPGVEQFIPMVELANELGLNKDENGRNNFQGDAGFRVKMKPIGDLQPNFGAAFVLPLDSVARNELHWGFVVSLIFDF